MLEEERHTVMDARKNWGELNEDLLTVIAERIHSFEDFAAFGAACNSWQSVATKENFNKRSHQQLPWLMLAERGGEEEGNDMRNFFSLERGGAIHRVMLPEARGKRCMESLGWLVTSSIEGEMNLLHPISRVQIPLPHTNTFKYFRQYWMEPAYFVYRAVLSSSPSRCSSDYVVMTIHGGVGHLGFWKPGDTTWTVIEQRAGAFCDVVYYKDQFYAINYPGQVWVCNLRGPNPNAEVVGRLPRKLVWAKHLYLVESAGALLAVTRDGVEVHGRYHKYGAHKFEVFDINLNRREEEEEWKVVKNLGDRALFLGHNSSVSIDASRFPGIVKPNCIYYTDDCFESYTSKYYPHGGGKDMGIYSLEDGRIEHFYEGKSLSRLCPPIWVSPSF